MHRRRRRGCCARCLLLLMSSAGRTRATCFCTWGAVASRRGPDGSATASTLMSIQEEQVAERPTLSATAARYQRLQRLCHSRSRSHSPMPLEVLLWHSPPACAGSRRAVSPISRLYTLCICSATPTHILPVIVPGIDDARRHAAPISWRSSSSSSEGETDYASWEKRARARARASRSNVDEAMRRSSQILILHHSDPPCSISISIRHHRPVRLQSRGHALVCHGLDALRQPCNQDGSRDDAM